MKKSRATTKKFSRHFFGDFGLRF
ncbi:DUF1661 domain-containing protein [Porphyromonas gingivalis]|nr:DUF1661 domain-containing protein [Porphyromonas gingivalis]